MACVDWFKYQHPFLQVEMSSVSHSREFCKLSEHLNKTEFSPGKGREEKLLGEVWYDPYN